MLGDTGLQLRYLSPSQKVSVVHGLLAITSKICPWVYWCSRHGNSLSLLVCLLSLLVPPWSHVLLLRRSYIHRVGCLLLTVLDSAVSLTIGHLGILHTYHYCNSSIASMLGWHLNCLMLPAAVEMNLTVSKKLHAHLIIKSATLLLK